MSENPVGDARAIINVMRELHEPSPIRLGEEPEIIALPKGIELHSLKRFEDERRERPERREGTAELSTLDSFVEHVQRFKDVQSVVFAKDDRTAPALLAVYDYHEAELVIAYDEDGDESERRPGQPRFGKHRARYLFPVSDEWKAWTELEKAGPIEQAQLAEFLEDHLEDVLPTDRHSDSVIDWAGQHSLTLVGPDRLSALAAGLSINVEKKVVSINDRRTGEARILFEEQHSDEGGGPVSVPGGFALAIPVFRGGDLYSIPVRLRYRMRGRDVKFSIALHRIDRVFDVAFGEAVDLVRDRTGLPVFHGQPET